MPDSLATSAIGMTIQREKLNQASMNIALMDTAVRGGTTPPTQTISFEQLLSSVASGDASSIKDVREYVQAHMDTTTTGTRQVYEPHHALADENGMVEYPDVDHLREMITVVNAKRLYEANIKTFNATKSMMTEALSIGK